jgi:hypothetical protein
MPYTNDPTNSPTDSIRLSLGDTFDDIELLTDSEYEYYLDKYDGNERRATIDAARAILFKLSRQTRERIDVLEIHGDQWARQYREALLEMLRNPELTMSICVPYAGGISKDDMYQNDINSDNVTRSTHIGYQEGKRLYEQDNSPTSDNSLFGY